MTSVEAGAQPQSAAAPSPFPPIAEFAFLSNCHTGALVAPDGGRRLAVRAALRLAERVRHAARPPGRVLPLRPVRRQRARRAPLRGGDEHPRHDVAGADGLDRRARRADARAPADGGHDHAAHAAAVRRRRRPPARPHRRVHRGRASSIDLVCEPVFDYGRVPAEWTLVGDDRHAADATGARRRRSGSRTDLLLGIEGDRVRAAGSSREGERVFCALSWAEGLASPADVEEADAADGRHDRASGARGSSRARIPDHRWREPIQRSALAIKGLTYMPTGATVAALTTSLPETPGGERNWDYRYTWIRDATFTLQALHWLNLDWEADEFMQFVCRPRAERRRRAADHVRDRRAARPDRVDARRALRLRGRTPGAGRQRRLRPAPERRLRRRAGLDPAALRRSERLPAAAVADRPGAGGRAPTRSGASPTRGSGRRAASRSTTCPRSSCAGSRSTAPPSSPRSAATTSAAHDVGARPPRRSSADILEHGVDERGVLRQHYDTDALDASTLLAAIFGFLPGDDARHAGERAGDRGGAHRARLRPALPDRRDRRRPLGQGGHVPDLLVLARLRAGDHRRASARARPDGAAAARGLPARPLRRGVRRRHRAATSATSPRRSPTSP